MSCEPLLLHAVTDACFDHISSADLDFVWFDHGGAVEGKDGDEKLFVTRAENLIGHESIDRMEPAS